jgi:hypothetical protein
MFKGNEGEKITIEEAVKFTENYRNSEKAEAIKAEFIGKESLAEMLNQDECVGIRFYFGRHDNGNLNIVAVGCDENGEDLYEGIILEKIEPCPPFCPSNSPLG